MSGALGIAGGILLGRTALQRRRSVLGIPVPDKIDLGGVSQKIGDAGRQVGDAGQQLGKLVGEVRSLREKAEQIGRVLG